MTSDFASGMSRATQLTRDGKLTEATALIRALLAGATAPPARDAGVIEGTLVRPAAALAGPDRPHGEPPPASPGPGRPRRAPQPVAPAPGEPPRAALLRRSAPRPAPLPQQDPLPPGAEFPLMTHRSAHGSRDYRLYVPAARHVAPVPLLVMLHGCTQTPEDFAIGTGMNRLAEAHGLIVAWPAQPAGANPNRCWNWFRPGDQQRERGEPALLAGIVGDIAATHAIDPARVYVAGLSAGGAAAAVLAAAYPELFSAVGVHSGLPAGSAHDIPTALAAMRKGAPGRRPGAAVPMMVIHGTADATVHPRNAEALVAGALRAFPPLQVSVRQGVSAGGRGYRQTRHLAPDGRALVERWEIAGAGHAWAGGHAGGSFTDPRGPDASRELLRFLLEHRRA